MARDQCDGTWGNRGLRRRWLVPLALALLALAAPQSAGATRPHPSIRGIPHGIKSACSLPFMRHRARCHARVITHPSSSAPLATSSPPATAYSPSQIAHGYGFDAINCGSTCGQGQTIAIVDAYDAPNIESDLGTFDSQYGLPACTTANGCFKKVFPGGSTPSYDAGWEEEISLDVEWAHAMAPGATIVLEESADNSTANLYAAVDDAVNNQHASVVSMSWGGSEYSGESADDAAHFNKPGVTFIASAGDGGSQSDYPAASPYVTAVGGTTLNLDTAGNRTGAETAWSCSNAFSCSYYGGTGGYTSPYEAEPDYQTSFTNLSGSPSIGSVTGNERGYADVSYDADPNTGVAIYDSGQSGWLQIGGTSTGAPQWAALVAIAKSAGSGQIDNHNIYGAAGGTSYAANFHDITSGQNGTCGTACTAAAGWDEPTGLGTPVANQLVNALDGDSSPPPSNDFSISSSPSSLNLPQNTSGSSSISTAVTSGSAGTVDLSASGVPAGASATLTPSSVTAGQSSTLSVNAGNAAPGSYTITVTGTEGSSTHTSSVGLTVSAPPSAIVNGGFETGNLTGWSASGVSGAEKAVRTANYGCHSGSWCARLGLTTPTNGSSNIAQTFTAPAGSSTLSFYYKVVCPDTVQHDWATATLKDNNTGTTVTALSRTCTNSGSWVKVSHAVTAGHSYKLTLTSHDDNHPGDATYTLYDDVAVR